MHDHRAFIEITVRWKEKYGDEKQRNKDIVGRMEREKQLEMESMALRFQVCSQCELRTIDHMPLLDVFEKPALNARRRCVRY